MERRAGDRAGPEASGAGLPADTGDTPAPGWLVVLRLVLVAAQATTILLTWPTWQVRDLPPCLPLVPVPQWSMGWPLLATLAFAAVRPRIGVPAHTLALAWAILADQCRLQPQAISLATLLWGTGGWAGGIVVMRAALVALWFYAGLHKLVSPDYYANSGPWLVQGVWPDGPGWLATPLAASVAVTEIGLALGSLVPRCRRAAAAAATAFHVATFLVLAVRLHGDRPVWPWNLALACAAPLILLPWRGPGLGFAWRAAPRPARGLAIALVLLPLGYWLGVVDAYLAHALYSDDTPRAFVCTPFSRTDVNRICARHGVVLPPAHRLYAPFFRAVGRPGEWLEVEDRRWIAWLRGFDRRKIFWNDLVPAAGRHPAGRRPPAARGGPPRGAGPETGPLARKLGRRAVIFASRSSCMFEGPRLFDSPGAPPWPPPPDRKPPKRSSPGPTWSSSRSSGTAST